MYRRLYFTFPTPGQTRDVVADLETAGVERGHMHATAKTGTDLSGLPRANQAQRTDKVWLAERLFWYGNLAVFALAALGLALALYGASLGGIAVSLVIMLATFIAGQRFAVKVPHAHLADVRVPLEHGEVVLMVDVPFHRVREIEHLVSQRHPEAGVGGVGWTMEALRI
ncbi:MAG: hypothetical protein U9Q81_03765 [Pseudomonadota bacterium]|nr:hypothetical protein [Pseudomonadota bacterium]